MAIMKKKLLKKKCENCNIIFEHKDNKRNKNRRFCTGQCAKVNNGKSNKGRKHSIESSEKKRLASLGEKNHFFGKKHSKKSLQKMSESSLWSEEDYNYCNLTEEEQEVLDGLMLGDGSMADKSRISSRLSFGFKFKETCLDIFEALKNMNFSPVWQDKNTKCWHSKSNMYHNLLKENKRWYPKGEKIIPKDIILTSTSCYWWFIGDGYVSDGNVFFCTDSFQKKDILYLIFKFKQLNLTTNITSRNRIRFDKKSSIKFMNWIGENNIIHKQYEYKFENFKKQINE